MEEGLVTNDINTASGRQAGRAGRSYRGVIDVVGVGQAPAHVVGWHKQVVEAALSGHHGALSVENAEGGGGRVAAGGVLRAESLHHHLQQHSTAEHFSGDAPPRHHSSQREMSKIRAGTAQGLRIHICHTPTYLPTLIV